MTSVLVRLALAYIVIACVTVVALRPLWRSARCPTPRRTHP